MTRQDVLSEVDMLEALTYKGGKNNIVTYFRYVVKSCLYKNSYHL